MSSDGMCGVVSAAVHRRELSYPVKRRLGAQSETKSERLSQKETQKWQPHLKVGIGDLHIARILYQAVEAIYRSSHFIEKDIFRDKEIMEQGLT